MHRPPEGAAGKAAQQAPRPPVRVTVRVTDCMTGLGPRFSAGLVGAAPAASACCGGRGTPGGRALLGPGGQPSAPGDAARGATPRRVLDLAVGVSGTGHSRSLIWAPPSGTASHLPPSPGQEGALPTTQPSAPAWPTPRVLGGRAPGDTPWDTAIRPSEDATAHTTAPRLISPRPMKGSAPASGIRGTACAAVQSKGAFWEGYAMQVSAAGPEGWA